MWGTMKEWLKSASIPSDRFLKTDLTSPKYRPDSMGAIILESKQDMKKRGLASPDAADAICVTFAFPIANIDFKHKINSRQKSMNFIASSTGWMSS